jgi:hypothetical protein
MFSIHNTPRVWFRVEEADILEKAADILEKAADILEKADIDARTSEADTSPRHAVVSSTLFFLVFSFLQQARPFSSLSRSRARRCHPL